MKKESNILSQEAAVGFEKRAFRLTPKRADNELPKLKEVPLSAIVIETGARDYGPPPDAVERRL